MAVMRTHRPLARAAIARLAPLAALLALGSAAVACSGSGDDTAATTTAVTDATTTSVAPFAEHREVDEAQLQAFADSLLPETEADGGIVAWKVGDSDPLVVTTGVADARTGQVIEPGDAFDVASITKSFVAATLVLLANDGELELTDPLSDFVPDWPNGDTIEVRQLLDHSSGVATFGNSEEEGDLYIERVAQGGSDSIDETLDATRDLPPVGEPGESTTYSNLNYVLAGAVIEEVTGEDIGVVFEQHLFEPLGMDATWYLQAAAGDADALPGLYELDPDQDLLPTTEIPMDAWRSVSAPAVGAVSTLDDLLVWADAVFRAQSIDGVDLSAMTEIQPGGYGLGVVGVTEDGACIFNGGCPDGAEFTRWAMNGEIPGSSTRLLHDPATDATLFVYLNRDAVALDGPMIDFLVG